MIKFNYFYSNCGIKLNFFGNVKKFKQNVKTAENRKISTKNLILLILMVEQVYIVQKCQEITKKKVLNPTVLQRILV